MAHIEAPIAINKIVIARIYGRRVTSAPISILKSDTIKKHKTRKNAIYSMPNVIFTFRFHTALMIVSSKTYKSKDSLLGSGVHRTLTAGDIQFIYANLRSDIYSYLLVLFLDGSLTLY